VEAEHAVQRQHTRSHIAHQHSHVPVLSHEFLVPTWAALTIECPKQDAVLHGLPPLCGHLNVVVLLRLRLRGLGGRWLGLRGPRCWCCRDRFEFYSCRDGARPVDVENNTVTDLHVPDGERSEERRV